jgi:para-nitrobenzyl esterase
VSADVDAALGIRYAAAPVGALRWRAPQPLAWDGERGTGATGPPPPQPDRPIGAWFHGPLPATSEDCLTLDVWAPAGARGRPVLVWLHGGGWAVGWGGAPVFDGAGLAAEIDAIVVTVNYRLGSLGWLCDPSLDAPHGDWGALDQAAALGWVRAHIAAFGGDPGQITLAGQSAGAGSVLHLLTSPLGEGLFARALAMSPPLGEAVVPRETGERWARALLDHLGVADVDAARGLPAAAIVAAHEELLATDAFRGTRGGAMPIVLPGAIDVDPLRAPERRTEVDVVLGVTADEATFLFRAVAGRPDPGDEQIRAITEHLFAGPARDWSDAREAAGGRVFRYRVEHPSPQPGLGAVHAVDVPLLFGTHRTVPAAARVAGTGPRTDAASAALRRAVGAFVRGDDPWSAGETPVF